MPTKSMPRLQLRGGRYYFRAAVPQGFRSHIKLHEIKLSLHTVDRRIALLRCRVLSNAFDVFFTEENLAQVPIKRIEEAAQAYFQRKLNAALELSMDIPEAAPDDIDQEIEGSKRRTFQISAMLRQKKFDERIAEQAHELLRTLGVERALPDALKYACQLVARAELLQNTFMIQELSGRPYDGAPGDPVFRGMMPSQLPDLEAAPTTDKLLGEAIEDYIAIRSKAWVAKTLGDQKRSLYLMRDDVPGRGVAEDRRSPVFFR